MHKDFYAEYYEIEDKHWWFVGRRRILLRTLEGCLPPPRDGEPLRILDVGSGTGKTLQYLSRYGDTRGVDVSEEAVAFCRERGMENVQLARSFPLPFEDDSFDVVTILDVIEHIDKDQETARELYRVLRPGGLLMLTAPAYQFLWGPQDEISLHRRRYVAGEIRRLLERAGLRVDKLSYFNTFLFPIIAAIRVVRRFVPSQGELKSDCGMTRPGRLNNLLSLIFGLEAAVVRRWNLPFGVSILCLAHRPETARRRAEAPLVHTREAGAGALTN
jgi:SAM-dependent methyltransferase